MTKRTTPDQAGIEAEIAADMEKIIDTQIEVILQRAEKVNEGNNGIICVIDIRAIPEMDGFKKALNQKTIVLDKEQAVKILKIYRPGSGKREFEMQKIAYEIVSKTTEPGIAQTPKPIIFRDIALNEATQERLNKMGSGLNTNRAEVILMNYIPSDDLATFLFREAVKMMPAYAEKTETVDQYDFKSLYRILAEELNFVTADPASRNLEQSERQAFDQNIQAVYKFLHKSGYANKPENLQTLQVIEGQIRHTVNLFHQNGLVLRDAHYRNFLVSKTQQGDAQVYIIDFGDAKTFSGPITPAIYETEIAPGLIKKFPEDHKVPNELRTFLEKEKSDLLEPAAMERLKQKYRRSRDFQKIFTKLQQKKIDLNAAFQRIEAKLASFPLPAETFIALIFCAIEENIITRELAKIVLTDKATKTIGEKKSLFLKARNSL